MKFCHISYRPKFTKNFHRWNPWGSGVSAVLHIFPNEKTELNRTSKYFLSEYVKKLAQLLHSGRACILYLKNILPNISNFCGLGRLDRLKGIFFKNLQPKNRVFIQKNTEEGRHLPESSDFFILAYFNKRRTRFYGGGAVSYIIYKKTELCRFQIMHSDSDFFCWQRASGGLR